MSGGDNVLSESAPSSSSPTKDGESTSSVEARLAHATFKLRWSANRDVFG